jgi:hypothetical protein
VPGLRQKLPIVPLCEGFRFGEGESADVHRSPLDLSLSTPGSLIAMLRHHKFRPIQFPEACWTARNAAGLKYDDRDYRQEHVSFLRP